MYQNLVLPAASFAFNNDSDLATKIKNYEMLMKAREQQERNEHPGASLLNTDPRQSIIPVDVRAILPT